MDCLQTLSNPDSSSNLFGPNYPTTNINYMNILARCPSNCHKIQGTVYGKGIHPDISPICLSALVDRAVSEYGGIISISIFPGLEKYVILDNKTKHNPTEKIKTNSFYGKPKKSFSLAKVDNVDLSERDIRILNAEKKYSNEGLVEMRINGKWGPICNKANNALSAERICKDLGYNSGFWANQDHKSGFCKNYKGKDYCGSKNNLALFSEISCEINDESINTCNKKYANPSECQTENNEIIICSSKNYNLGQSSTLEEKSLIIKEAPPALGRLSAVKIKANCEITGKDPKFRGDPGSLYLINCPANCKSEKGDIWGVGIYTLDSSICKAAIHAGVFANDKGGSFAFIKTWGQKYFAGLERNGINSNEFRDAFLVSFTVSSLNSQWKNMWKIWKQNSVGVYLEKNIQTGFLEKNKTFFSNEYKINKKIKKNQLKLKFSSFLEMKHKTKLRQNLPKAVFEWIQPNPSESFSDKENGSFLIQESGMRQLSKFQILIKASLSDFKNKRAFIFSYSGCNGFNVFLDANDSIVFGDACNEENQINTGIQFPVNDKTIIWAFYTNSVLKVAVFSEKMQKPIAKAFNKILDINTAASVGIGRRADLNDEFFFGYIDFVLVYEDEISFKEVSGVLNYVENKFKKNEDSIDLKETIDNRVCLSPCVIAAIPGSIGAPTPPRGADPCIYLFYFFKILCNFLS